MWRKEVSGLAKYIFKRILLLIPTVFVVCVLTFAMMRMLPGSALDFMVKRLTAAGQLVDVDMLRARLGLDQPALTQFFLWIGGVFRGDLGESLFQYESVGSIIARQLPVTIQLGVMELIWTIIFSVPLGVWCAARQDGIADYSFRIFAITFMAVPTFLVASVILVYPAVWWGYAPNIKYSGLFQDFSANMKMFLVPSLIGALAQTGMQLRMVRTCCLETLRTDYVRTAWAKGCGEKRVLLRHVFRNSMIPVITVIGGAVAGIFGGNVILENLFNIPGIGHQLVTALDQRDYPVIQGCVLVMAVLVMLINLIVDICYKWLDPRVEID